MRLIVVGCEYAGKTTLIKEIAAWKDQTMGPPIPLGMPPFHDHFTFPNITHEELSEEECKQVMALSPRLKSLIQNHQILYHLNSAFYGDHDNIMVGFHIENAVYGPLYYGYGEGGVASAIARNVEGHIMETARDTVLLYLKASPQVIAERMREAPHPRGVLKEKDIKQVLQRFEEECKASILRYKITLDTTEATVSETLGRFVEQVLPHLRETDFLRIQNRRSTQPAG